MGLAFMSTSVITGTITITAVAADGILITAAHPVTRYRVEIAHPTEVQRVGAITANAIEAVQVGRPRSLTFLHSSGSFAKLAAISAPGAGYRVRPLAFITDNTNTVAAIADHS
jgi:hypothetical protein